MTFLDFLSKLTLEDFKRHLSNYIDLYFKPLKVWRKIISVRTRSYNLLILHIVYYFIFVMVFAGRPFMFVIKYVILEVVITLIPAVFFFPAFKICSNWFGKHTPWNRLFRLFVILKLQYVPILILAIQLGKWLNTEDTFLFVDNFMFVALLCWTIIWPLIVSLKWWQRIVWISMNYISIIILLVVIGITVNKFVERHSKERLAASPSSEFDINEELLNNCEDILVDQYGLIIYTEHPIYMRSQFVTGRLAKEFFTTRRNLTKRIVFNEHGINLDTTGVLRRKWIDSLGILPRSKELNILRLDSFRNSYNELFYSDLKELGILKDSAFFKSNKEYYATLYSYLKKFDSLFLKNDFNRKHKTKAFDHLKLPTDHNLIMYYMDTTYLSPEREKYQELRKQFDIRLEKSKIAFHIFFYPLELIPNEWFEWLF